ncbi:glycosyltransferase [Agromyces aerolatus]|uniref:glycosyltransferase n=1 Tax=Agromyces sp. LY-1074 TaxID=3074080 RepID=UPI0028645B74|nr:MULTISPECIES: glycosyltransferase [unclassified Agromyces]MDR5700919.1 glycosyltransferase [Agromyces sp. LY-1074]MDR5707420.1 glycosyltransferase [Agromyces sp. LY-1358]
MLLITAGSRGDVEPFIALARAADAAGHEVRVAAPDRSGVAADGVDLVSLGIDYSAMIEDQGVSIGAAFRSYRTVVKPIMRGVIVGAARAALAFEPDIVVAHPKVLSAPLIAVSLGIPHVLVEMVPAVTPTRAFPAAGTVTADLGPLNRFTYFAASAASSMFGAALDEAAHLLGVRRNRRMPPPAATLLPISPALLERPDDWPPSVHLTGPWVDSGPTTDLEPDAAAFIAGGPFVYAGFGSMASGDPAARGRALVDATRTRGQRLFVATGLGGIEIAPALRGDDVFVVRSAPHDLVLPHAVAAVHHGGIGTVQAATRAGAVSVVIPFIADQPFWGAMLHRRGLAPRPVAHGRVTAAHAGAALDAAPRYREPVRAVAQRMRKEHGTAAALTIITALR